MIVWHPRSGLPLVVQLGDVVRPVIARRGVPGEANALCTAAAPSPVVGASPVSFWALLGGEETLVPHHAELP